jgi:26S proteasome regulatory subunit N3
MKKLSLDSVEETEQIVAKAIRDGVIDAIINHDEGFMQSKEVKDIYTRNDP